MVMGEMELVVEEQVQVTVHLMYSYHCLSLPGTRTSARSLCHLQLARTENITSQYSCFRPKKPHGKVMITKDTCSC